MILASLNEIRMDSLLFASKFGKILGTKCRGLNIIVLLQVNDSPHDHRAMIGSYSVWFNAVHTIIHKKVSKNSVAQCEVLLTRTILPSCLEVLDQPAHSRSVCQNLFAEHLSRCSSTANS